MSGFLNASRWAIADRTRTHLRRWILAVAFLGTSFIFPHTCASAAGKKSASKNQPTSFPEILNVYVAFRVLGVNDQYPNDQSRVVVKAFVKVMCNKQIALYTDLGNPPDGEANWDAGHTWHVYGEKGPACPGEWHEDFMWSLRDLSPFYYGKIYQWKPEWGTPVFVWREVLHKCTMVCSSRCVENEKQTGAYRKYDYAKSQTPGWQGWGTLNTGVTLEAGMKRYRVQVSYRQQNDKVSKDEEEATRIPVKTSLNFGIPANAPQDDLRRREYIRFLYSYLGEPYEYGGIWFGGRASPTVCVGGCSSYDEYGMDCSGLVSNGARWAGYVWTPWRRTTKTLPAVSTEIGTSFASPGHILNVHTRQHKHVRTIYLVHDDGDSIEMIAAEPSPYNRVVELAGRLSDHISIGYTLRRLDP